MNYLCLHKLSYCVNIKLLQIVEDLSVILKISESAEIVKLQAPEIDGTNNVPNRKVTDSIVFDITNNLPITGNNTGNNSKCSNYTNFFRL